MRVTLSLAVFSATSLLAAAQTEPLPYIFSTFAGVGGSSGSVDGIGSEARFARPWALAVDREGNLYVTEIAAHTVRKVTPTGAVSTLAGRAGVAGWADGAGSIALFGGTPATPPSLSANSVLPTGPFGLARDLAGNLLVADSNYHVVRQITPGLVVSTVAGTPQIGGLLDGPAATAQFKVPLGLVVLPDGSTLVADTYNHVIRRISPAGAVTTVAGSPGTPGSTDGTGPQARFLHPCALALAADGTTLYATDANNLVRRLTPTTPGLTAYTVTTIAGSALSGGNVDGLGSAARFGPPAESLLGVTTAFTGPQSSPGPSGGSVSIYAVGELTGLTVAPDGNLLLADYFNNTIRQITPAGVVTTIAGTARIRGRVDGAGTVAQFSSPSGLVFDPHGNLYVADSLNNTIRKATRATVPTIQLPPASRTVAAGTTATLAVTASAFPAPTYQWSQNGSSLSGATAATLTLTNVSALSIGNYTVTVTNAYGSTTSPAAAITLLSAPSIATQPIGRSGFAGETISLSVGLGVGPDVSYQWFHNGQPVSGATSPTLTIASATVTSGGSYTVVVTNTAGSTTSAPAVVTIAPRPSRIINLSVRSALTSGQTLTVGFVTQGAGKPLLIRAIGPTLRQFGLPTAMTDPVLTLFSATGTAGANDNWSTPPLSTQIATTAAAVGAFALPNPSLDAALFTTLGAGAFTAHTSDNTPTGGIVLIELYDADLLHTARLVNVSTRATAGTGDNALVAGFVVSGDTPRKVLLRAVGPTLASFGVTGTLADPRLEVFSSTSPTPIATNDNWNGDAALSTSFALVGAFPLPSPSSRDAALVVTLAPGSYSAQVTGVGATSGEVLLEVYEHP